MSERYLCLHCWRALARSEVCFRCDACEATGRPEWMRFPEERLRRLGEGERPWYRSLLLDEPADGGCPRHPRSRIRLFCECRYPLSERAAAARAPVALGVAGPPGSGKTLFFMRAVDALRRPGVGLGFLGLDDTEVRYKRQAARFFDRGERPPPSAEASVRSSTWAEAGAPDSHFAWALAPAGRRGRGTASALLAVADHAGATWALGADEARESFDRFLEHLGALVFLVDGASVAADLGLEGGDAWAAEPAAADRGIAELEAFLRLQERLGPRCRRLDLALIVSKADALWEQSEWEALRPVGVEAGDESGSEELLRRLLERSWRQDLLLAAEKHFRRVRLFAVSSLGFRPTAADVDSEGRLVRLSAPSGVAAPTLWLLGRRLPGLRATLRGLTSSSPRLTAAVGEGDSRAGAEVGK